MVSDIGPDAEISGDVPSLEFVRTCLQRGADFRNVTMWHIFILIRAWGFIGHGRGHKNTYEITEDDGAKLTMTTAQDAFAYIVSNRLWDSDLDGDDESTHTKVHYIKYGTFARYIQRFLYIQQKIAKPLQYRYIIMDESLWIAELHTLQNAEREAVERETVDVETVISTYDTKADKDLAEYLGGLETAKSNKQLVDMTKSFLVKRLGVTLNSKLPVAERQKRYIEDLTSAVTELIGDQKFCNAKRLRVTIDDNDQSDNASGPSGWADCVVARQGVTEQ